MVGVFPARADVRIEKTSGTMLKLSGKDRAVTRRGGKGSPVFKRGAVKQLIYPELQVPELEAREESASATKRKK